MYYTKPHIVVHDLFYSYIINNENISLYFDVFRLDDLILYRQTVDVLIDSQIKKRSIVLEPSYPQNLGSGTLPHNTSYYFDESIFMYSLHQNAPRYVIWTMTDNLPICGTIVVRIDLLNIYDAIRAALDWGMRMQLTFEKSIVVFDLDLTLIDENNKPYDGADDLLKYARQSFDYIVLWSHGSSLHVDENIGQFSITFDKILSNPNSSFQSPKNLLYLYNYFPSTLFTRAWLIDDSVYNWTPEYTHMIVPIDKNIELIKSLL